MTQQSPIGRIIKVALFTTPLMGIFGGTPGFLAGNFNLQLMVGGFAIIATSAAVIWIINISLLKFSESSIILQNNLIRLLISTILSILVAGLIFILIRPEKPMHDFPLPLERDMPMRLIIIPIMQGMAINVMVFILIELVRLKDVNEKVDVEIQQLKIANMQARINHFMEQLNPHFLFNSLSTLRSLITRSPEKAEDYLVQLSQLLRFSTTNNSPLIPLATEVEFCRNYLNMQKVRFGDALNFTITIPNELQVKALVPVYCLQQLAENAIKHNILTKEHPLIIHVDYMAHRHAIKVQNNLQPKEQLEVTSGSGLTNLSERCRLLGFDDIEVASDNEIFNVSIKLTRNESNNN